MTLYDLLERFPTDEACRLHLIQVRWPDGVTCPRCQCQRVSALPKRKQWTCLGCRYRFSAISGTVFENTKIRLRKWFTAILMVMLSKKSQSSLQVNRQLGVSQERCWHMVHRIREMMRETADDREKFTGVVQVDDYYHGGIPRKKNRHKPPFGTCEARKNRAATGRGTLKQPVLGAVHSDTGKIRTAVVRDLTGAEIISHLEQWCDTAATDLHTDEFSPYRKVGRDFRSHEVVKHSREYCRPDGMHTNSIESAWSLFDRAVVGSFHHVSVKHLQKYLSEFESRFNTRNMGHQEFFDLILRRAIGRQLSMRQLVGRPETPTDPQPSAAPVMKSAARRT